MLTEVLSVSATAGPGGGGKNAAFSVTNNVLAAVLWLATLSATAVVVLGTRRSYEVAFAIHLSSSREALAASPTDMPKPEARKFQTKRTIKKKSVQARGKA